MRSPRFLTVLLPVLALGAGVFAQAPLVVDPKELPRFPAVEPRDALATFQVRPGFHLELAASEPLVASPIAVCFDENGRMFVLEMRDYSEDRDVTPHLGRVRVLEDTDGDGRYDKATIFADDLAWPTALIWAKGGLFVLATPELIRFEDHDGDGKAEKREVIFTGFQSEAKALNVQGLPNCLQWGPDNQIHLQVPTTGASRIRRPAEKEAPAVTGDFYFDPRTYQWGTEAGGGQYGMSYDNEGRRYTCNNSDHLRTYIYDSRLVAGLTGLPSPLVSIAADGPAAEVFRISPDEPWRVIRTRWRVSGRVKGIVEGGGRVSGYFTGATGTTVYRGDAFPLEYVGDTFTGDAGGNLVHHKRLRADGVSLIGERPPDKKNIEFAASRDTWFRPVNFANAPDGTLYIVDMYREVIEHPHSIPVEIKKLVDLTSGRDRGRIWRLAPDGFKPKPPPKLGAASTEELVATLGHPNGWHRDTATRLLIERNFPGTLLALQRFTQAKPTPPLGFIHAMRAMEGLAAMDAATPEAGLAGAASYAQRMVRAALQEEDRRVREAGVATLAKLPAQSRADWVLEPLQKLAADPDARVRLRLALALDLLGNQAIPPMLTLAAKDAGNPWISSMLLASKSAQRVDEKGSSELVHNLVRVRSLDDADRTGFLHRLASLRAADPKAVGDLDYLLTAATRAKMLKSIQGSRIYIDVAKPHEPRLALLAVLAKGLETRGQKLEPLLAPETVTNVAQAAKQILANDQAPLPERIAAIRFFNLGAQTDESELVWEILRQKAPLELQRAALTQVAPRAAEDDLPLAQRFLTEWSALSPGIRGDVVRVLAARPARAQALLQEVKAGRIAAADIPTAEAAQLQQSKVIAVAALAQELLPKPSTATREEVIKQFEPALALAGDKAKGKEIYTQRCAMCHRFKGEGNSFGPDLESVVTGGKEKLLTHFLDPNREVAPQFTAYTAELKDGTTLAGIVASETPSQVILREPLNKETTLPREKIARLQTTGRSPMPEGLEAGLTTADVAGLLGFLTGQ